MIKLISKCFQVRGFMRLLLRVLRFKLVLELVKIPTSLFYTLRSYFHHSTAQNRAQSRLKSLHFCSKFSLYLFPLPPNPTFVLGGKVPHPP